ncbi:MAG TPA: ATP-binding protein [Gemmatimonadaceae bacterium]|nr:ATP-binding protein [Gemmatimonadaceae bacterium]
MNRSPVERQTEKLHPATDALASNAVGISEARYRTLIQAISQIVWTRSPSGEFGERQIAWEEFTGQTPDEYLGWGWLDVVHEDDRLRVKQNWRRAVEAASPYYAEYRLRSRDGVHRWVAVRAAPVLEADGRVREWIGTHSDIDASKRAYEERARLFESERGARLAAERAMNRLRSAWSVADAASAEASLDDMLHTLSEGLRVALQADEATVLLLDVDTSELVVRASVGIERDVSQETRVRLGEGFSGRVALARSPVVVPDIAALDTPFLRERLTSLIGTPLRASGRLVGVIHAGTVDAREFNEEDVILLQLIADRVAHAIDRARILDAERSARAEAELANRAKMEFLAMISHELRTPLNAIAGYAELLAIGLRGPLTDAQLADVQAIHRNERHLLSLIEEVLTFAKLDAGRIRLDPEDVRVSAALASMADLITPQVEQKQLSYQLEPVDPSLAVYADVEKLQQIVVNLLSNAVKFTPAGGHIRVGARALPRETNLVEIRVRDTGIGIPKDKLQAIFEPFVQLDGGLTRTSQGTGLGLAISRDLARAMHGDLVVDSEEGEWTEFVLTLPRGELLRPVGSYQQA